jgi:hypothetical protein
MGALNAEADDILEQERLSYRRVGRRCVTFSFRRPSLTADNLCKAALANRALLVNFATPLMGIVSDSLLSTIRTECLDREL